MTDDLKCINKNCKNKRKDRSKYCSELCRQLVLQGEVSKSNELEEYQMGTIILANGIEIRNDAMGKDISAGSTY